MVNIFLNVEDDGFNLDEEGKRIIKKGLDYTTQDLLANLISNSPVDTGLLRSWALKENSDFKKEIKTPAVYASYVNDGTGVYGPSKKPITSKTPGKPLVFTYNGVKTFAMSVKGQKGQKFVEKSIDMTDARIDYLFERAFSEEGG